MSRKPFGGTECEAPWSDDEGQEEEIALPARVAAPVSSSAVVPRNTVRWFTAMQRSLIGLRWPMDENEPGPWVELRGHGITPDSFQDIKDTVLVMSTYSTHGRGARPALGTVGMHLGVSHVTAQRWLALAVKAELLRVTKAPVRGRSPAEFDVLDPAESPLWADYYAVADPSDIDAAIG